MIHTFEDDRAKLLRSRDMAGENEAADVAMKLAEVQRGLELLEKALEAVEAQLSQETSRAEIDHGR